MSMVQELLNLMAPDERVAEFGTIEEKRAFIKEARAKDPNWVNTVFPSGKDRRGVAWTPCHRGLARGYMNVYEGHAQWHGRRDLDHSSTFGARPGRSRKARRH